MVGALLRRRDRATFRVVGREGSCWVLAPEGFGPTILASPLECSELFAVVTDAPDKSSAGVPERVADGRSAAEQAAWDALAKTFAATVAAPRSEPLPLAPEEHFRAAELTAEEIVGSPRLRWAYRSYRLAVDPRTAADVDALLDAEEA